MAHVFSKRLIVITILSLLFVGCNGSNSGSSHLGNGNINQSYNAFAGMHDRIINEGYPLDSEGDNGQQFSQSVSTPKLNKLYDLVKKYVDLGNQIESKMASSTSVALTSDNGLFLSQYLAGEKALAILQAEKQNRGAGYYDPSPVNALPWTPPIQSDLPPPQTPPATDNPICTTEKIHAHSKEDAVQNCQNLCAVCSGYHKCQLINDQKGHMWCNYQKTTITSSDRTCTKGKDNKDHCR